MAERSITQGVGKLQLRGPKPQLSLRQKRTGMYCVVCTCWPDTLLRTVRLRVRSWFVDTKVPFLSKDFFV